MPQLHNIRAIFSLRFPIFSNWNQLWHKLYLFISIEGQLLHRILQASVKPQHESAIGIHISPPSWNSLPPPFPSHSSRLTQSPFSQFPEPYSKFLMAIHFTHSSVSFMTQTWEASWIAEAPIVFTSTLFLSLANAVSSFAFIFSSASAWLLHWSRPEVPQWSHHLSFPSKLHLAILGVQKRKKVKVLVTQFATPWTLTRQAPLSIEFPRQENWSGLHFLLQGSSQLRNRTLVSCIAGRFFTSLVTREAILQIYYFCMRIILSQRQWKLQF